MKTNETQANNTLTTAAVQVEGVSKHYGGVQALNPTSFSVASGSYFVLLGPSGGGKTTLLRLIGGFIKPTEGRVIINGNDVTALPANKRDSTMVFQSYALFPHMSVKENVAYGLGLRSIAANEVEERVAEILDMVGLGGFESRMPHELSGGQQQRVQLARSLVLESSILLLDEPLAALDANLRKSMCFELKRLQETVGITFIHVTHNQEEAMSIADEIALIADGELVETGSVREVYESPRQRFTAEFIGESTILDGRIASLVKSANADKAIAAIDLGFATVYATLRNNDELANEGEEVSVSLRSESAILNPGTGQQADDDYNTLEGSYQGAVYLGFYTSHVVRLANGHDLTVRSLPDDAEPLLAINDSVRVGFSSSALRVHGRS